MYQKPKTQCEENSSEKPKIRTGKERKEKKQEKTKKKKRSETKLSNGPLKITMESLMQWKLHVRFGNRLLIVRLIVEFHQIKILVR
jgi:hypothetical protein